VYKTRRPGRSSLQLEDVNFAKEKCRGDCPGRKGRMSGTVLNGSRKSTSSQIGSRSSQDSKSCRKGQSKGKKTQEN